MKSKTLLTLSTVLLAFAAGAATDVSWTADFMSQSGSTVSTNGTLVYAYCQSNGSGVTNTVNTVPFVGRQDISQSGDFAFEGNWSWYLNNGQSVPPAGLEPAYSNLLAHGWYSATIGEHTLRLNRLTPGSTYSVQLVVANWDESHGGAPGKTSIWAPGSDTIHADAKWTWGGTLMGTFTAQTETESFTFKYTDGNPFLNAIQVREIATGGQALQTHYDIKQLNHFAFLGNVTPFVSQEKLHLKVGAAGHWRSAFQYEVTAGFADYASQPMVALGGVSAVDFKSLYLQLRGAWHDTRVDVDGGLRAAHFRLPAEAAAYAPAAFTADLRGTYNWQKRIYAGAYLQASTARRSLTGMWLDIPGYADFGLLGEYRLDKRWTAWAQLGNLFGMAIERVPGNIEKSPYVTVGFSLKL